MMIAESRSDAANAVAKAAAPWVSGTVVACIAETAAGTAALKTIAADAETVSALNMVDGL